MALYWSRKRGSESRNSRWNVLVVLLRFALSGCRCCSLFFFSLSPLLLLPLPRWRCSRRTRSSCALGASGSVDGVCDWRRHGSFRLSTAALLRRSLRRRCLPRRRLFLVQRISSGAPTRARAHRHAAPLPPPPPPSPGRGCHHQRTNCSAARDAADASGPALCQRGHVRGGEA